MTETALGPEAWRMGYFDEADLAEYRVMVSNHLRFSAFQEAHRERLGNHYYVIVVPKTLDMADYCLRFLPREANVFVVMNGLAPWEEAHLEREFPHLPAFKLELHDWMILHDRVLDMFVECNDTDFGVFDQDCFILDPGFLRRIRLRGEEYAVAPFVSSNPVARVEFPRTYFLFFNIAVLKELREKYRLSFKRCWTIPEHLEEKLKEFNFGYHNFPHRALDYFDNFQLIWAMAMHDRIPFKRVATSRRRGFLFGKRMHSLVHVGAGHRFLNEDYRDAMVETLRNLDNLPRLEREKLHAAVFAYFAHLILLENIDDEELRDQYMPFFSVYESATEVVRRFGRLIDPRRVAEMHAVIEEAGRRKAANAW
jgi:hypothetical protein